MAANTTHDGEGGRSGERGRYGDRVLIVGAGMSGITAARTLADRGCRVTVAEKGRALGGRMASRMTDHGSFDHGAQYVTGKGGAFRAVLTGLSNRGTVEYWKPTGRDGTLEWHVGVPAMNGMLHPLTGGYDLYLSTTVTGIERDGDTFAAALRPHGGDGRTREFDRVLLAVPSPQATTLGSGLDPVIERAAEASYAPCWTLMLAFDTPLETTHDIHRLDPGDPSPVSWAARENGKPGREGGADRWTIHATPPWTTEHLERERGEVIGPLMDAFAAVVGETLPEPVHAAAHRWRYSRVERPLGDTHLLSDDGRVGACGDWCLGPRVEAAFESGRALADAVKERL